MTKLGTHLKLTADEEQVVSIPNELWDSSTAKIENCLVARVLTRKNIHLELFEKAMLTGWNLVKGDKCQKLGDDRMLIEFNHEVEKI